MDQHHRPQEDRDPHPVATFLFFILGGVEALMIRLRLGAAQNTIMDGSTYNGLVSMHGSGMVFLVLVPIWPASGTTWCHT